MATRASHLWKDTGSERDPASVASIVELGVSSVEVKIKDGRMQERDVETGAREAGASFSFGDQQRRV